MNDKEDKDWDINIIDDGKVHKTMQIKVTAALLNNGDYGGHSNAEVAERFKQQIEATYSFSETNKDGSSFKVETTVEMRNINNV